MISKTIALDVLNAGLATGADFAEIFVEEKSNTGLSIDNDKIESISSGIIYGAGIRLLKDLRSVYGYTNDLSKKGLMNLATTLAGAFNGERIKTVTELKKQRVNNIHKAQKPLHLMSKEDKIAFITKISDSMKDYGEQIVRRVVSFADNNQDVTIFNSDGKIFHDVRERGRMYITALAANKDCIENSGVGPGASKGFEFFEEDINPIELAKEVCEIAIKKLDAKECPSGKMPVVIGNGFGGVIFHEACGHALEASSVSKNLSIFSNKLGQQIASKVVTAIDDGTIPNGWGSNNIDDEGNKTNRTVLIKNGILTNYLIDDFNGRRMGMKGNGASRRQSYAFEPTSRMSNTYIAAGKSSVDEMIKSVKLGLYAKSLGGGSVNPTTGDFNFTVDEAYMIRDGKVAEMVKGATLIGNGADILMKIDMVGSDVKRAQGMCGAASGSCPVDVGQPTIRVSEITVGGRGGALK